MDVFPFGADNFSSLAIIIYWILVIDWAHIFAQWLRIYSNPAESSRNKLIYPLSYLILVPLMTCAVQAVGRFPIETFLIYFVIYHFIRQNFGYIRIYSKTDGPKEKWEERSETAFIYLSMVTPLFYWHVSFPHKLFTWTQFFMAKDIASAIFPYVLGAYILSSSLYLFSEIRRTKRNGMVNLPKNLSILAAAFGWGLISFLGHARTLIYFTVVLAHDLSYTVFVWLIVRRDEKLLQRGKVRWNTFASIPGFLVYLGGIIFISQLILLVHHRFVGVTGPNIMFGDSLSSITHEKGWWESFGVSVFFSTQAHHYFIDRYLWKKEKDLGYLLKTGKFSLSSPSS